MNESNRFLLVCLAGTICVALLYTRLHSSGNLNDEATPPAAAPAPRAPALEDADGRPQTGEVVATVDWAEPNDPQAVPLDWRGERYLFDTRRGLQIFDSTQRTLKVIDSPLPGARLVDQAWASLHGGVYNAMLVTLVDNALRSAVVATFDERKAGFDRQLVLPPGFLPTTLLKLDDTTVLLCGVHPRHALVLVADARGLRQATRDEPLPFDTRLVTDSPLLRGPVDGFTEKIGRDGDRALPYVFDTMRCAWTTRERPGSPLEIRDTGRFDARALVTPDSRVPKLWSPNEQDWMWLKEAPLPLLAPRRLGGMREQDALFAAEPREGRVAFMDRDGSWREPMQRLPAAASLKLLPANGGALALLAGPGEAGRVLVVAQPAPRAGDTRLIDNGLPARFAHLPRPPQAMDAPGAAQLADGSVIAFGGTRSGQSLPAYRWLPGERRWQNQGSLQLAHGSTTPVAAVGNALYYIAGATPHLWRWHPDQAPVELARLPDTGGDNGLLALADGRLLLTGDPDEPEEATHRTFVYDPNTDRWQAGPDAPHAGGRAVQLADGTIFKLTHTRNGYVAATSEAGLHGWAPCPPFPLAGTAEVSAMAAVNNQVVLALAHPAGRYVTWDDAQRRWSVLPLPNNAAWSLHTHVRDIVVPAAGRVLLIYDNSMEELPWPLN